MSDQYPPLGQGQARTNPRLGAPGSKRPNRCPWQGGACQLGQQEDTSASRGTGPRRCGGAGWGREVNKMAVECWVRKGEAAPGARE